MGPITEVFPAPRVVPCGGRQIKVSEFRLRDLVALQSVLDGMHADPLFAVQDQIAALRGRERWKVLSAAYDVADVGPAVYGEDSGRAYYSSPEGAAVMLWVAGRRWKSNGMTPELAGELFAKCTPGEFGYIWRICHGVTPFRAISRLLTPFVSELGGISSSKGWGEMVDQLSSDRGWTYGQILNLTLTQWVRARNEGTLPGGAVMVPRNRIGDAFLAKQMAYEAGEIDEMGNPIPSGGGGLDGDASGLPGGLIGGPDASTATESPPYPPCAAHPIA